MVELEGTALTIYDEVMDEIEEELTQSFGEYIVKEKLKSIINDIKEACAENVVKTINDNYSENMSSVQKMILGEKLARKISPEVKTRLRDLSSIIVSKSFDLIDELRNDIIGEVFEETEN